MNHEREAHWQAEWAKARLEIAQRIPGREKFYALVAYPGSSGFLHIGHLRGPFVADAMHRYHRMLGHQVFFPTGTHASGLPAVTFAHRVRERQKTTIAQLELNEVDPLIWPKLEDPEYAARFLGSTYLATFKSAGVLVDPTADVTTIDPDYRAFIRWQFHRLHDKGALVQGPYFSSVCPVCGPVAVDPSETDLSSGGDAEVVHYTTVPFAIDDRHVLLAATLRPETIYGVTNLWIAPHETLVAWKHEGIDYYVSRFAAERLVEQHGGAVGHAIPARDLIGHEVEVPITGERVPIRESRVVTPKIGTGIVMSVPAHAPADWLAVAELSETDRAGLAPIRAIVSVPPGERLTPSETALTAGEGVPAERALKATETSSLDDAEALTDATERLYRLEFTRGRMTVPSLADQPVATARDQIIDELLEAGRSFELQEFSKPVRCRNGHEVVIRRIPDQWFLHYADPEWKKLGLDLAERMSILPTDYAKELPGVIEWFADRPCSRRGVWLGTPFPYDPEWTIEPIADSTFYPAYFVVRRFVRDGRVRADQLTDAFFDFVFLGQGPGESSVDHTLLEEIRAEFLYWYPLDVNVAGKEHKRVHLPVFVLTHALLLPRELQPKRIYTYWWLTMAGGAKISKSKEVAGKGATIPRVRSALDEWGADALRLYFATAASPFQDIEWDPALADDARDRLNDIERLVRSLFDTGDGPPELDRWLIAEMHELVAATRVAYENSGMRDVAELIFARLPGLVRRYFARGGVACATTRRVALAWIRLMSPLTPHLAEELGQGHFPGLVAVQPFPTSDEFEHALDAIESERFLDQVESDLRAVLRPAGANSTRYASAAFYVAAPWKETVERWMRELAEGGRTVNVRDIMERVAKAPELNAYRGEIPTYVQRVAPLLRSEAPPSDVPIDESGMLRAAESYLCRRLGFREISVHDEAAAAEFDPQNRRARARPRRPAFYLFSPTETSA
jgi:leucyl-tRNA synthetase